MNKNRCNWKQAKTQESYRGVGKLYHLQEFSCFLQCGLKMFLPYIGKQSKEVSLTMKIYKITSIITFFVGANLKVVIKPMLSDVVSLIKTHITMCYLLG